LNALVLQSLTKGAKLDEFTLVEAAAGFVYVLVAIVEDALLPAAWVRKHLSGSVHDDALFAQALTLLPQGQQRLLVAVRPFHVGLTPYSFIKNAAGQKAPSTPGAMCQSRAAGGTCAKQVFSDTGCSY
jgi:hypothetical protein